MYILFACTRIPIEEKESYQWLENIRQASALLQRPTECVHIGDRESNIYELFCAAEEAGTKFLVRTCVDRLAENGSTTINRVMKRVEIKGIHEIEVQDADGKKCYELFWRHRGSVELAGLSSDFVAK